MDWGDQMAYKIYLAVDNGSEGFNFQDLPEEINIKNESDLGDETLVNGTSVSTSDVLSLRTVEFDTIFYSENEPEPQFCVNLLRKWQVNKTPVRFIYIADNRDINMLVKIESFEHNEKGGAVGDITCSLSLTEYKPPAIRTLSIAGSQSSTYKQTATQRFGERSIPSTYTLVKGDCLWKIAKKFYGDGNKYKDIQKLNNIPDSRLRSLPIGLVVKLP